MKILFIHNAYQKVGGEDSVVDAEMALLRAYGHEVEIYRRHNNELNTMSPATALASTLWSQRTASEIARVCNIFQPDIIHAHNTFPLVSPSLYWAATRMHIPLVQTLHNFRLLCPQGMFLREGKTCQECVGKVPWRAVARKCYRQSALQSAVLAGMLVTHRSIGTYRDKVTRYIALNSFCRNQFIAGGLPPELIRIKPNFVDSTIFPEWKSRRGGLFVGRLSVEKGLDVLMAAVQKSGLQKIEVIGDGPYQRAVANAFGERYHGFLSRDAIMQRMRTALFLLVPSIGYENSPCTIMEAFSCGLPVIASRLGPLADLIEEGSTGLLFTPGDAVDLGAKIAWAEAHPDAMLKMGQAARAEYEAKYTPQINYRLVTEIYDDAIAAVQPERNTAQGPAGAGRQY